MRRLITALLLTAAAGSAIAGPASIGSPTVFDKEGYLHVAVDGKKAPKMTSARDLIKVLGDQVPASAAPKCPSHVVFAHFDRYMSRYFTIFLCDGTPPAGHIYNGAYYESPQMKGAIVINDEPGLKRVLEWPK